MSFTEPEKAAEIAEEALKKREIRILKNKYGIDSEIVSDALHEMNLSTEEMKKTIRTNIEDKEKQKEKVAVLRRAVIALKDGMLGLVGGFQVGRAEEERAIKRGEKSWIETLIIGYFFSKDSDTQDSGANANKTKGQPGEGIDLSKNTPSEENESDSVVNDSIETPIQDEQSKDPSVASKEA
jgi:hypothetical protein